jgi:thiol:disulfide interchange protein DsbA
MKQLLTLIAVVAMFCVSPMATAATQPKAGVNYHVLDTPQSTSAPQGKVEVIEFFWYGCPHCYAFQPYLEHWLKQKPDNVDFIRVPVATGFQEAKPMAQAFYTEKSLGLVDKLHDALFDQYQKYHHLLKTKKDFKKFFEKHGVSGKDFDAAWDSFSVAMDVKRAANKQKAYHIMGVPTIAVDGRYTATLHRNQGVEDLPGVIDYLVKKSAQ